ncbi:MAG: Maf family protein, partial [Firmicutes bacterium]|nr:Maf family protein [Bacillota bacterium]
DNDLIEEIKSLAYRKAYKVFEEHKDSIVIGSDTIVVADNQVLGKPKDRMDAINMLHMLNGKTHMVITGVCIIDDEKCECFANVSKVTFDKMSDEEISSYVDTKEPMDKAGAYAIQGMAAKFIERIDGDYYSIMGLPLHDVYKILQKFNCL